ncbi:MAG TPA: M48 family metallopeptidase [Acidimicrobiales bacterium]|nr:M48 family metallopeptidase [Acidimicrobiales bacterium]
MVVIVAEAFSLVFRLGSYGFLYALVFALLFAGIMSFISYWNSDKVALAITHAVPADPQVYARLYNLVEGLCIASGLPQPKLYVVDDPAPNAFATGRDPKHASLAVTSGLLEKMNRVELEGVLAHELSHVKNYDILVSSIAVCLVGVVAALSDFGLRWFVFGGMMGGRRSNNNQGGNDGNVIMMILALVVILLAPLMATLMQFAVSRRRESLADVSAVEMTRYPPGLISALEKLRDDHTVVRENSRATAHLWIEEPMDHYQGDDPRKHRWSHLFDTHPPIEERIAALREM